MVRSLAAASACAALLSIAHAQGRSTLGVSLVQAVGTRRDLTVHAAGTGRWLVYRPGGTDTIECRGAPDDLGLIREVTHAPASVAYVVFGALVSDVDPAWSGGDGTHANKRRVEAQIEWFKGAIADVDRTGRARQTVRDQMRFTVSRVGRGGGYSLLILPQ